jgi:hypothetical protein
MYILAGGLREQNKVELKSEPKKKIKRQHGVVSVRFFITKMPE